MRKAGLILMRVGYVILVIIEWVTDTIERVWNAWHVCLEELTNGLKNEIDVLKNGK